MNTSNTGKSIIVLHNHRGGNNQRVAEIISRRLGCEAVPVGGGPDVTPYETVVLVIPNTGDEELPQPMEDYLCGVTVRFKDYVVCELGNYFGFENYRGCKKEAIRVLDGRGWRLLADVSIDSLPRLDAAALDEWLETQAKVLCP